MAAHAERADVVEEDHAELAVGTVWGAEQGPDQRVGAARLVHDRGAKAIVLGAEAREPQLERAVPELGPALEHEPRRLAARVRVDHADGLHAHSAFEIAPVKFSGPCAVTCTVSSMRTPPIAVCSSTSAQFTASRCRSRRAASRNK